MQLQKGQKLKLEDSHKQLDIHFKVNATFTIDISCFGLDVNDKLSNDAYMVFFNQKASPANEIKLVSDVPNSHFSVNLSALPPTINKLVFTAAVDASASESMAQLKSLDFTMNEFSFALTGNDFSQEKAVMIIELYKKDNVWRLGVNGQGFNGGLEALLVHFGGVAAESVSTPVSPPKKLSLEKRFEEKAPKLVSLAKKATLSLEKNNLSKVKAKSAFVIDASGSMTHQYNNGQVQETVYRVFPLGVHFDDDEELETWAFANLSKKLSNVNFANYEKYVTTEDNGWKNWMRTLNSAYNNEPAVIRDVIQHFSGLTPPELQIEKSGFLGMKSKVVNAHEFAPAIASKTPVFVLFISDGGVSRDDEIEFLIRWSSTLPIFWQFIGIGGSNYGALEKLDNLQGRYIDNADFFSIDDLKSIGEAELYDRMMGEFPKWLQAAHAKGMIDNYKVS